MLQQTDDSVNVRTIFWVMLLIAGGGHCYEIADSSIFQIIEAIQTQKNAV